MSDKKYPTIPLNFERHPEQVMKERARAYYELMDQRRSVRAFSSDPIPLEVVHDAIRTASTAPSGAHKQPWRFAVITKAEIKKRIREAAEKEERETYKNRMSDEWRAALAPLGTDANKPYLEIVPVIIAMFRIQYDLEEGEQGEAVKSKNYYVQESCGIALGMLIAALHNAGLATLTHTPSPMNFLAEILERPANERAFMLLPVGYPVEDCRVPDLQRKPLADVLLEH